MLILFVEFLICICIWMPHEYAGELNVPLLRNQVRGFSLMAAARLYRHGYPEYLTFREFRHLFEPLVQARSGNGAENGTSKKSERSKASKAKIPYLGDDKQVHLLPFAFLPMRNARYFICALVDWSRAHESWFWRNLITIISSKKVCKKSSNFRAF